MARQIGNSLLIVDDDPAMRKVLMLSLENAGFATSSCQNGQEAIDRLSGGPEDPSCILLDIRMPVMSGLEALPRIRKLRPLSPVIMLTAFLELETGLESMKSGAFDYLVKPARQEQLIEAVGRALRHRAILIANEDLERENEEYRSRLEKMVEKRTEELKDAYQKLRQTNLETVRVLAETIDAKDAYTRGHSQRVRLLCASVARHLGIAAEEIEMLEYSALLHDIGKIGMPEALLHKEGPLERHEVEIFRRHPVVGESILSNVEFFKPCLSAVRQHHEHWNGEGYPDGIAGSGIAPYARIISVCDSFDAMTSTRPYRRALPVDFALSEIKNGEGSQFAPDIVGVFLDNRVFEEVEAANLTKDAFASALRSSIMDHL